MSSNIDAKMERFHTLFWNIEDGEIAPVVETRGLPLTVRDEARQKWTEANSVIQQQKQEYRELELAYAQLSSARETVVNNFLHDREWFRLALRSDKVLAKTMGVTQRLANTTKQRVNQALEFYQAVLQNPECISAVARFAITRVMLEERLSLADNTVNLREIVRKENGEAQLATQLRDKHLEGLEELAHEFEAICRLTITENQQLLEKLGIVVKN